MAPFKSTGGFSVGKLLGVFRNRDLTLNSSVRTNRIAIPFSASGGNIDGVDGGNGYKYHVFTSPGTFNVSGPLPGLSLDVLLIGGGGSGGATGSPKGAGGAGAGGVVHHSQLSITGSLTISVGTPGVHPNAIGVGVNGGDSTIVSPTGPWTLTAKGGGGGGHFGIQGLSGGSGGGGGGYGGNYGNATAPGTQPAQNAPFVGQTGFNQYGNRGGAPTDPNPGNASGGGGGGGVGDSHPPTSNGGAGQPFPGFVAPIPAFAPLPAGWKTAVGPSGFFAGGGAGENPYSGSAPTATGGSGGGGSGASANGVTNTGSGGAGMDSGPAAGDGGDGICIIRYTPV